MDGHSSLMILMVIIMIYDNLKIKNFGPVKQAEIDVAPLTIFVGSNGSGKSYSSILIHSLLNPFDINFPDSQYNLPVKSLEYLLENNEELFNEFNDKFIKYLDSNQNSSEI